MIHYNHKMVNIQSCRGDLCECYIAVIDCVDMSARNSVCHHSTVKRRFERVRVCTSHYGIWEVIPSGASTYRDEVAPQMRREVGTASVILCRRVVLIYSLE